MDIDLDTKPEAGDDHLARAVPTIDMHDPHAVARIAEACSEWGFFQVVNHGIDAELVEATWQQSRAFFAQPTATKEAVLRTRDNPWGYYNNELTKNQRDKKEVFDYTVDGVDPVYSAENRWPDVDGDFKRTLTAYRDACTSLSLHILEKMSEGLGLAPEHLASSFSPEHTGFIRLNFYPVADPLRDRDDIDHLEAANMGVHHHTDAGALTVLLQDSIGGLQVFNNDAWYDVPPVDGAFVVNTGDMMQVWSNDQYRAAIHRVRAMSTRDRYSIPFFFNPRADAVIEPLPSVAGDSSPARYRPICWSEFRRQRTDGDYADYGTEVQISQYRIPSDDQRFP